MGWGPDTQRRRPGAPAPAQLLKCHPGLTKKRVELVPWSTAPTNGPKTAFFVAAMKPASGRRQIAAGFPGDGGQGRRGRHPVRRARQRVTVGPRSTAPLPALSFLTPPLGPQPAPNRVPQDSRGVAGGRCLPGRPIGRHRKTLNVRTIRGLCDVTGAGPGRGGGGGPRSRSRGARRPGGRANLQQGRGRRRVLPIGREGHWPGARAQPHPRPGPTACGWVLKCRTACSSDGLCLDAWTRFGPT